MGLLLVPVRGEHDCCFRCGATAEHDEGQNSAPLLRSRGSAVWPLPFRSCAALGLSRQLLLVCRSALRWNLAVVTELLKAFRDPIPRPSTSPGSAGHFLCLVTFGRLHTFAAYEVGNRTLFGTAEGVLSRGQSRLEEHRSLGDLIKLGPTNLLATVRTSPPSAWTAPISTKPSHQAQLRGVDHLFATLCTDALGFTLFFLPVTLYLTWLSVPFAQQSVVSQEHSGAGAQPLG